MFCNQCGSQLSDDDRFCSECGAKVFIEEANVDFTEQSNKVIKKSRNVNIKKYIPYILIVLIVLVAIGAAIKIIPTTSAYKYRKGISYMKDGNYEIARNVLYPLGNYKDCIEKVTICNQELCPYHFGLSRVVKEPSCTTEGLQVYTCEKCGKEYKVESIPISHDYILVDEMNPSCTELGLRTYRCSKCYETKASIVPKLNHNYSKATCKSKAKCSDCGATLDSFGPHNYTTATCTAPSKCTVCGEIGSKALGHTTNRAFCARCGVKTFSPLTYSGHGPSSITNVVLPQGMYNIKFTHNGLHNYIVYLNNALVCNEVGQANYVKQLGYGSSFVSGFQYPEIVESNVFNITHADGNWTITIDAIK